MTEDERWAKQYDAEQRKEQDKKNLVWFKRVAISVAFYIYICGGLYWFYPEVLNMLFWPFHYGWLAH